MITSPFTSRPPSATAIDRWRGEVNSRVPLSLRGSREEPLHEEWIGFIPFAPIEGARGSWGLGELFLIENGTAESVSFHPIELFRPLLILRAPGFFLLHFHPSGSLVPSPADELLTRRARSVAQSLGIGFGGHAIVTESRLGWITAAPRTRRLNRESPIRTGRMTANGRPLSRHELRKAVDRNSL